MKASQVQKFEEGIAKRIKTMRKHVVEMCTLLRNLHEEIYQKRNLEERFKAPLKNHFRDIYWSLKLHLVFHLGIPQTNTTETADIELQEVGKLFGLENEEINRQPDQECAIDPGSKLLEIVSMHF